MSHDDAERGRQIVESGVYAQARDVEDQQPPDVDGHLVDGEVEGEVDGHLVDGEVEGQPDDGWQPPDVEAPFDPLYDGVEDRGDRDDDQAADTAAADALLGDIFTAKWLDGLIIPDIEYVVEDLITEGSNILVAAPKAGKSWLAADLALAVAQGGIALGAIPRDRGSRTRLGGDAGQHRRRHPHQGIPGAHFECPTVVFLR